ncbi:MAG: amine oxidase, partial [Steroidobacteraceae bacterium]
MPANAARQPLRSFWMGGFEGADHINCHGAALDMNALSGHVELLEGDYARLAAMGFGGVRESVGWRIASLQPAPGQRYDFARLRRTALTAQRSGAQVLWTLMHYGIPDDLNLTDADFTARFAEFAGLAAREIRRIAGEPSVYTPINEIGFLAWAYTQSHLIGSRRGGDAAALCGYETKCRLVKAALAGVAAI